MTEIESETTLHVASAETISDPVPAREKDEGSAQLKLVPPDKALRVQIRQEAIRIAVRIDRSRPLTKEALIKLGESLLKSMGLPRGYLGFVMVAISNEFWRDQFMAIDFKRRLLLLPHCLKSADVCHAGYDEAGMNCKDCGACRISDFKVDADELGYKVLVAEGTPAVLKVITSGSVDAILGVACLNVLERAFDKVLKVGVPSMAVPLLSSDCKDSSVDDDWVMELLKLRAATPVKRTRTYLPLLRLANDVFSPAQMTGLVPRLRTPVAGGNGDGNGSKSPGKLAEDPIASTEQISCDWLVSGGKRFRPFITLAAYDALKGGLNTRPADVSVAVELPEAVKRVAMAMEVFHKASLIHDDIEDDDTYRYGRETLHRRYGVPVAINAGDYLIGLGYRLVSREGSTLGPEVVSDILDQLAQAHQKLAEGQGAELIWRQAAAKELKPLDALNIYALKTVPAFQAALYAGMRMAGSTAAYDKTIAEFSRQLGVAFQIINDLEDWDEDDDNKLVHGQDVLSARPTLLLALALEKASTAEKSELARMAGDKTDSAAAIQRVRGIYTAYGVFDKAETMVRKFRDRALKIADATQPEELRELMSFLVETVLER